MSSSLPDRHHHARLRAVSAPYSGDWLHALPISSCGLRSNDEAVRVAVGLRLGAKLREPHQCPRGSKVNPEGTPDHGLACRLSTSRITYHLELNDLVWRALGRANMSAVMRAGRPCEVRHYASRRIDAESMAGRKVHDLDVTDTDTLAESYLLTTSSSAGGAAPSANRKELKYQSLTNTHTFIPLAFETFGPINSKLRRCLFEPAGSSPSS